MAEPYTFGISGNNLAGIDRWLKQKRASGQEVHPWELESAYRAALGTEADRASTNYFRGKELEDRDRSLDLTERQIKAGERSSAIGGVTSLATNAAMLNYMMKKPVLDAAGKATGDFTTPAGDMWRSWRGLGTPASNPSVGPGVNASGAGSGAEFMYPMATSGVDTAAAVGAGTSAAEGGAIGADLAGVGGLTEAGALEGANIGAASTYGSTAAAPGAMSYLGPAGAGFAAPGLLNTLHKDSTENLGHNLTLGLVRDEGTARAIGGAATGAAAGVGMNALAVGLGATGVGLPVALGLGLVGGLLGSRKGTWLCTETKKHTGLTREEMKAVLKLRRYSRTNHPELMAEYLDKGPILVTAIEKNVDDLQDFYTAFKIAVVNRVKEYVDSGDYEAAFLHYEDVTRRLFKRFAPEAIGEEV